MSDLRYLRYGVPTPDCDNEPMAEADAATDRRLAVCNLCEAICGLEVTLTDGSITGIRGNPADPLSRGYVCPKGVALADVYADPDRLRRPVRRIRRDGPRGARSEEDTWAEIGWDEAFDLVARRLSEVTNRLGDDALGVYLGNPNVHSLGSMTHGTEMVKRLRTRNRFSATSVDQLPHQLMAHLMLGHQLSIPVPDIDRTSYFLMFGANPMASNGSLMTVPDFPARVRALKARSGRLVVFDPRRTETAKVATEHHFVRPGSDAFVLLAMLQVLTTEGLAGAPSYAVGLAPVTLAVADFTPERAEQASGVPAEEIRRVVREFAAADRAVAYGRVGISTHEFGSVCVWAITCLNALTGNLDRVGGAMLTDPAIDAVGSGLIGAGHLGHWRSRVRGLPETHGELPVSALREEIETPGSGQIKALLTVAGNPVLSTPDGVGLDRALDGLDFMASVDFYVNETTRHADVILPPTTILERDHYDLVFHLLAVRNTARFTPAVFAKGADQRHDWEIFAEISRRTSALRSSTPRNSGQRTSAQRPSTASGRHLLARHFRDVPARLLSRARLRLSPTAIIALLLRRSRTGVTLAGLRRHPAGIDLGPLRPGALPGRLQTKSGRLELAPDLVLTDLDRLNKTPLSDPTQLLLIGRRHQRDNNAWMHNVERLTRGRPRHHLWMHPDDLAALDLDDGQLVRVTSAVGSVDVEVAACNDLMPGVASLPHGYGHGRGGTGMQRAATVPGVSLNDLTDPTRLDVSGNAALTALPITVSAAEGTQADPKRT